MNDLITTKQAAERLRVSLRRVRALIEAGRLPSQQFGREHLIKESDLALVANRPTGRPKKANSAKKATKKATKKRAAKKGKNQ